MYTISMVPYRNSKGVCFKHNDEDCYASFEDNQDANDLLATDRKFANLVYRLALASLDHNTHSYNNLLQQVMAYKQADDAPFSFVID